MSGAFLGMPGRQNVTNQTDIVIGDSGKPIRVYGVTITSGGGGGAVVILRDGTAATATAQLQINGTTSLGTNWSDTNGLLFPNGCFADVDSNTANLTVSFVKEF